MEKIKIAIVGAGRGGTGLMELFLASPGVHIESVVDPDAGAPGVALARQNGITVLKDIKELRGHKGIDLIINVTGQHELNDQLHEICEDSSRIVNTQISSILYRLLIESNQLRDEIEKTKAHLQEIIDTSRDMIITTDASGKVKTFNQGAEALLGYSIEEIAGRPIEDFYTDTNHRKQAMDIVFSRGYVSNFETTLQTKSGKLVDISLTLNALYDENGEFAGTVGVSKDITMRKQNEKLIQEKNRQLQEMTENLERIVTERTEELEKTNERLTEINRYKSQFIANMSHELRTPLNSIIGFSEILMDGGFGQLNDKQLRYTTNINKSGHHLLQIINDILDLSKIDAGKMELQMAHFDINELIQSSIFMFDSTAMKKGLELKTVLDQDSRVVYGDQGRIKQVIYNLVSNAVKFTPEGGKVIVETKKNDGGMQVSVTDSGIGISEDNLSRIFNEFEQADNSYSREYEGTGLGLPLVRKFLQMHGSDIGVQSKEGEGTTFYFNLPFNEQVIVAGESSAEAASKAGPTPDSSVSMIEKQPAGSLENAVEPESDPASGVMDSAQPLVLIVEDDPGSLELIALTLAERGYRTAHVRTGELAVDRARELRPDLITLDVMLPSVDGWEIIQALKADPVTKEIPVVIVTMTDNRKLAFSLGAVEFMNKPLDRSHFARTIDEIMERYFQAKEKISILVVDDREENLQLVNEVLSRLHSSYRLDIRLSTGGMDALQSIEGHTPDLLILDLMMPEVSGFDVIHTLKKKEKTSNIPILVLTAMNLSNEDRSFLDQQTEKVILKSEMRIEEFLEEVQRIVESVHENREQE